jgi:hypothetical protein
MKIYIIDSLLSKKEIFSIFFVLISCTKENLPINKKISLQGTYVFDNVSVTIVDNSEISNRAYYDSGAIFINPNDVKGVDTIIPDFSLMKIQQNKVFFDAEIYNQDTIWNVSYDCMYNHIFSYKGGLLTFYPQGSKRDWAIESINGKEFVIAPPLFWPYSNNGPAYSLVFKLLKVK